MLEDGELGCLPRGSFLDRALKMSPVFRQTLCDIIIFLMNRKSRNDDYSHVCISLLGPHRIDSFVIVEAQPADPFCVQGLKSVSRSVVFSVLLVQVWVAWLAHGICGFSDVRLRSSQSEHHSEDHVSLS